MCAVAALAGTPGMLLYTGETWRRLHLDIEFFAVLWVALGIAGGFTAVLPGGFAVLVPALGLVTATGLSGALAASGVGRVRLLVVAAFSVLIFLPLSLVVFGWGGTWLYKDLGGLDFAGAIPFAIGSGAFLTVHALRHKGEKVPVRPLALRGAMLVAAAAVGCAVGMELRVDELTPAITLNMLLTPALAMLSAGAIERVKRGQNTREGLAAGTLAGVAAAMAASAYLETVSAMILGLVAGAVAEAAYRGTSVSWRLATPLLIGGATGMLFLGIFGLGGGFVYSGQPLLLVSQTALVIGALIYSALVSTLLLLVVRRR